MKNYFLKLFIVFSLLFNSGSSYNININKTKSLRLENTFVFISTHLKLEKINSQCVNANCYQIFDNEKEVDRINNVLIDTPMIVGSGFIYDLSMTTKILTADHLCTKIDEYLKYSKEFNDSKIELLSELGESIKIDHLLFLQVLNNHSLIPVVTLFDFNGNKYKYNKTIKQDKNKDLCAIESDSLFGEKIELSEKNCTYGEEVVNISAADGIYLPKAIPYYTGIYSGHVKNSKFKVYEKGVEVSLYSIDISEGSSGSAVFSKKTNKLCGNINASLRKAKLSLGSSSDTIKEFLDGDTGSRDKIKKHLKH
jgi:hypothetical protein